MGVLPNLLGKNRWEVAAGLLPVLADALHWLVFEPINQQLRLLLLSPSELTVLGLLALYFAYCVALFLISLLKPDIKLKLVELRGRDERTGRETTTKTTWPEVLFFYPSFGFGIVMIMAAASVSGMMDDKSALSEGWQQLAVFGAVGLFFLHLLAKFAGPKPRVAASSPIYLMLLLPTIAISELMLNLSTALWYHFLGPEAGGSEPSEPSTMASFVIAVPLFLLFFAAPRFTFMSKHFTWLALLSGVGFALYELWQIVGAAPLL